MIPWPIAFLTLFYGVIATLSAATIWRIATGVIARPLLRPLAWLAVSSSVTFGLPLLKSWGRTVTVAASALMALTTLAVAGLLVVGGRPLAALLVAVAAGGHILVIRYLQRPAIKAYFGLRNAECGLKSGN